MHAGALQLIFFTLSCERIRADLFSATTDIVALIQTHDNVVARIEKYIATQERRLKALRRYLKLFKQDEEKMKRDDKYAFNPINAFSLIHKLTEDLRIIKDDLKINGELMIPEDLNLPLEEDLHGAALGIGRLQKMYNLNVTKLAAGIIRGTFSHSKKLYEAKTSPMTLSATFQLGRILFKEGDFASALDWLHEALDKYNDKNMEHPNSEDESNIIDYIRQAYYKMTDYKNAMEWTDILMQLRPTQSDLYEDMVQLNENKKDSLEDLTTTENESTDDITELCRGEVSMAEDKRKHLHCFYKSGPSLFLRLAPIKAELLHADPAMYLFYDTISDAEIKFVQNASLAELRRAEIFWGNKWRTHSTRISKTGWLEDGDWPVVEGLSARVSDFTDLSVESAEDLQVANYGIGGYYAPHYDFLEEEVYEEDLERIATVLFYMTNVEQGGATVFLSLNLTVFPVKNAALFWLNLLPSGEPDYRTYHAACPVLVGSKWAGNKWLHVVGQELIKPCDLEYQENQYLDFE